MRASVALAWVRRNLNSVEKVIADAGGSPMEVARRISRRIGCTVTRQRLHGWRRRGRFPRQLCLAIHEEFGLPLEELVDERRYPDPSSVVRKALAQLRVSPSGLATMLTGLVGKRVTRQAVNNWLHGGKFPREFVLPIHQLTGIPIAVLL
jgi:hypothetical protein